MFRRGDSVMVTVPRDVRRTEPWRTASYVAIELLGGQLTIRPLLSHEFANHPRSEEEGLPEHGDPDAES